MTREEQLEQRIELHKQHRKESDLEGYRRGMALEKINKINVAWKDILPEAFYDEIRETLDVYIERCTISKGNEHMKYQKRPRRGKK